MPIPRQHFELGVTQNVIDLMVLLHSVLKSHPNSAFTAEELAQELKFGGNIYDALYSTALQKLTELNAAQSRWIAGSTYYSLGPKPLEL